MSTKNLSLDQEPEECAEQLVATERYSAASEMVRDVELGWLDMESGRVEDFDPEAIKAAGRERLTRKSPA